MNTTSSSLASFSLFSPGVLAASTLDRAVDVHSKNPSPYSPMEQVPDTPKEPQEDKDTAMNTLSSSQTAGLSRSESAIPPTEASIQPSTSAQPTSTIGFPKPPRFSSNLLPPTPPTTQSSMSSSNSNNNTASSSGPSPKTSPRLSRPQLTSRMSSRAGGKRHASIGSQREMPFMLPQSSSGNTSVVPPALNSPTPSHHSSHSQAQSDTATAHGWNARLREMGLYIPGMGQSTPKTPKSGSMSSGAASPKSPEEQRSASYFSFRRRGSHSNVASPGRARTSAATPPPPSLPPASNKEKEKEKITEKKERAKEKAPAAVVQTHSPISEESLTSVDSPKHRRANLSLDLGTTLTQRGSTASLPLIGHTPVGTLVQGQHGQGHKPRRGSTMTLPPAAPPPHIHTPPVLPPSYEYPFLPNHAPRKPLEVLVEEVHGPGGPGTEGASWLVTVRLPGFHPDGITIGTRRGRVLVIVADNYNDNDDGAGHFERRISFGYDADMTNIRAEFNGDMLKVTVTRRTMFGMAAFS